MSVWIRGDNKLKGIINYDERKKKSVIIWHLTDRKWKLMGVRTVLTLGIDLGSLLSVHVPHSCHDLPF